MRWQVPDIAYGLAPEVSYVAHVADTDDETTNEGNDMTSTPAAKPSAKATPAKAAPAKPAQKAPVKEASLRKEVVRTSHSDCTHVKTGAEGKKARAACRREKAAEAAKAVSA